MSGYAGVFHLDGAPLDPSWIHKIVDSLAFRGPDGHQTWVDGSAGLCHTLLRTSTDTDGRPQVATLQGLWITGDARIDDRQSLVAALAGKSANLRDASSLELILHTYAVWGEACTGHLLGDFSFVIWDPRRRKVFAARDHFGVKPLFYALIGQCLIISNTLDCIRQIPIVPPDLNEQAIGDYLITGQNKNPATTYFAAIRSLLLAHRMIATPDALRTERYWSPPIEEPLHYRRRRDYIDQFHQLLGAAVGDRLPDGPVAILLSGGLDSPALAATAVRLEASVIAFTNVFERLVPDQEGYYAGLVARQLGIPIHYNVQDDEPIGWQPGELVRTPEPSVHPIGLVANREFFGELASHARVVFHGYGPDDGLRYDWKPYLKYLIRQRKWGRACASFISDFAAHPRIPVLSRLPRLWTDWKRRHDRMVYESPFVKWINPEFQSQFHLQERWQEVTAEPPPAHPLRPLAFTPFASDFSHGEGWDANYIQSPVEFRLPFLDLRLVRFFLALPPMPWCRNKYLLRAALRGSIPEEVRSRPKTPFVGEPFLERARQMQEPVVSPVPLLAKYVDVNKVPTWPGRTRQEMEEVLRVLGLRYWLAGFMLS